MDQLVNFVVRPPRAEYNPSRDLLEKDITLKGRRYQRQDLKITNHQGHTLQCSHYMPFPMPEDLALPCVIYCHGNSGCRADANEAAIILLPSNITVFTLDFSGSGLSEGEFVTLGWNETNDLKAVVSHLRSDKKVSCIGLWGRSMGAVTSLLYGAQDPSIAGMVLDSPFANLVDLMMELVDVYKIWLPKFTFKVAVQYMRKVIQKKAQFDIMDLDAVQFAKNSFIPALFGHATEDLFIQPHHSDTIYKAYQGDKNIIKFEGDHNSPRPQFYYDSITIFFYNVLRPPDNPVAEISQETAFYDIDDLGSEGDIDKGLLYEILSGMQPSQIVANSSAPPVPGVEDSTEEAINQSRSRWQMSRTEMPSSLMNSQDDVEPFGRGDSHRHDLDGSCSSFFQRDENGNMVEGPSHGFCNGIEGESWGRQMPSGMENSAAASSDIFAQFPSTLDDEERMLMEAIAASLQDASVSDAGSQQFHEPQQGSREENPGVSLQSAPPQEALPRASLHIEDRQNGAQSSSTGTQTIGMFEALGQRWGIGLFRAMGSRRADSG